MTAPSPRFAELAARDGVLERRKVESVDADRFAALEPKVGPMTWAVGAVVTDDAGRVLLVREDGEWLAPGGEVEPGETHEEALVREVREETGVEIGVGGLVAVTNVAFECGDDRLAFDFAHYTAIPTTTALAVDPGLDGEGIETVEWVEAVPENTVDREVVRRARGQRD
ncbi:ADP-ribose pyrophosphatase YjhB, NUDIX family [Halorientalis persicus]|jgi:8-oxo-dGTP diphosphatase|uniref:ADP-ribose pyrophosphatase YjhB, NUDIX family n=1 Tax=Halorientalis persicus TaxID=1367881 RepID=A0A1H8N572_9EURY|nr:NUDIX domain-containing protein [Halorientalis persicus]SEO24676.1 ADP-ribose pyrophosphatase YjhB, NUDIX family [Halorientalis persicus]